MTTTRLYLIRHGATSSNEQRPYVLQGSGLDHALSETGRRQAAALGEFMRPFQIDRVYASPMKRAVETAQVLANPRNLTIETFEELKEVDVGDWEGRAWEKIEAEHPVEYAALMNDPWRNPYMGGESYSDVLSRIQPVLMSLVRENVGRIIAVVAHQVVNRSFIAETMNLERDRARDIKQSNTGINLFKYRQANDEIRATTVNGDFHLYDLD